jgi:ParB/RepB/Spo0J family partition protein
MELEFHQLDLRYAPLRRRDAKRERQVLASLAEVGQLLPVVVVGAGQADRYVLLDGHKRARGLRRLHADTVRATVWALDEVEALLLERRMRHGEAESALEQGWLLRELTDRFGMSQPELARRFDRTQSWVSRRLALVGELPVEIQDHVRSGAVTAHAAMRFLAPMARAMRGESIRLARAIAAAQLSTRQVGELYVGWKSGSERTRELLLSDPLLYLRAQAETRRPDAPAKSPGALLLDDMALLGTVARRAYRRLCSGSLHAVLPSDREEIGRALEQATADLRTLGARWDKEVKDAG